MRESEKKWIKENLVKINFVKWDRYFKFDGGFSFFGWINREKDDYKDFVLLDFIHGEEISFATSSKEYSKKIAEILNQEHSDCQRVEDSFDIDNCIKLKDIEEKQNLAEFLSCRLEYSPELIGDLIKEFRERK